MRISVTYFGHSRISDISAGSFPRVRNSGDVKILEGFSPRFFTLRVLVVSDQAFAKSSGFSFVDLRLALIQNKKNSGHAWPGLK
jgi:hypothetical protein